MQMRHDDSQFSQTYLIMMPAGLVAQDMTETLLDHDPTAQVLLAQSLDMATGLLAGTPALIAAFVAASPVAFEGSDLQAAIRRCDGQAVLLGVAAERAGTGSGWISLPQPFFPESIRALVETIRTGLPAID